MPVSLSPAALEAAAASVAAYSAAPAASPTLAMPVWQEPFVEVLRYGLAHRSVGFLQLGDVEQVTDPQIRKNVFKIRGAIAATNYMRVPRDMPQSSPGLALTGRYVYIQLRRTRDHPLTLHLDLLTAKKAALRFSLSSMYTSLRSTGTVLRVPLQLDPTWTTIVVDMRRMLQCHTFNGYSRDSYASLKAVTCCAAMNLRNVFTSSTLYTAQTLPPALALPPAHENQHGPFMWVVLPEHDSKHHSPIRQRIAAASTLLDEDVVSERRRRTAAPTKDKNTADDALAAVSPLPLPWHETGASSPSRHHAAHPGVTLAEPTHASASDLPLSPTSREAGLLRDRQDVLSKADQILREAGFSVPSPRKPVLLGKPHSQPHRTGTGVGAGGTTVSASAEDLLSPRRLLASEQSDWPDPILELSRVVGFSSAFARALHWLPDASACVYASHATIVLRHFAAKDPSKHATTTVPAPLRQSGTHVPAQSGTAWADPARASSRDEPEDHELFLRGHSGAVCALAVSPDGCWLASAEGAPACVVRVWDLRLRECVTLLRAASKSVGVLAFAPDSGALCCVGTDDHARTQIHVYDCRALSRGDQNGGGGGAGASRKLQLRARQTCDFPIHAIAFSPYESDQLVSCGRENVRFWRVHAARHHLPGAPVILREYSRGTVFTALAFDRVGPQFHTPGLTASATTTRMRPVYVASSVGTVLVVDYDSRDVVCVYKLHDAAIHALAVNEGFCVTGADDCVLRVWPLDFTDFFLEAEHEAHVRAVDVSSDGMQVLVGSANGALGVLDLAGQHYRTVLRAHTQPVHALGVLPRARLVTSAADSTLRVWDLRSGHQTMEFDVAQDRVTCVSARPVATSDATMTTTIAVGFASGCTRVFAITSDDLSTTNEATTQQQHLQPTDAGPRVLHEFQQHASELCDVQYAGDGRTLFTSARGAQLCMYDVEKAYAPIKMLLADVDTQGEGAGRLCLSQDGRFVAAIQQSRRGVVLLDAMSLCVITTLAPPAASTHHRAPRASSSASGVGSLRDMEAEASTELTQVVISWNSQELLMLSRSDRLYVFSLRADADADHFGRLLHSMPMLGQRGITAFALSPNLQYMATGGHDGSLRVWQCTSGRHQFQRMYQSFALDAVGSAVRHVAFAQDGARVVATCAQSSAVFVFCFRGNTAPLPTLALEGARSLANLRAGSKAALAVLASHEGEMMRVLQAPPVPAAKPDFRLPLDAHGRRRDGAIGVVGSAWTNSSHDNQDDDVEIVEEKPEVAVESVPLQVIKPTASSKQTTQHRHFQWTRVLGSSNGGSAARCCAWACALGCLVFAVDATLVVEELDSGKHHSLYQAATELPSGRRMVGAITMLVLSPTHDHVATVSSAMDCVLVHDLAQLRAGLSAGASGNATRRMLLPRGIRAMHAVEFSADASLLCVSCSLEGSGDGEQGQKQHHRLVVFEVATGELQWRSHALVHVVSSVHSLSPTEFLLFIRDGGQLQRLTCAPSHSQPPHIGALVEALPARVTTVCLRDDGDCTLSSSVGCDGGVNPDHRQHQRARLLVAVDEDAYCFFYDLQCDKMLLTTQLLLPLATSSSSTAATHGNRASKLSSVEWVGTKDWEALIAVTADSTAITVYALPMLTTRSRVSIDWTLLARGGLACTHVIAMDPHAGGIARVLVDPLRDIGVAVAHDGAAVVVQFRTGHKRLLRASIGASPWTTAQYALRGSQILTISADGHALRCWEPECGRELGRLQVAGGKCTAFAVSAFNANDRAVAGYADGALRLFDVSELKILAHCVVPPRRHTGFARGSGYASPVDAAALSTLKQRHGDTRKSTKGTKPHRHAHTTVGALPSSFSSCSSFQHLRFLGPNSVVATMHGTTTDERARVLLFDFSEVAPLVTSVPDPSAKGATAKIKAASRMQREKQIHYREVVIVPDRARTPATRECDVSVRSIDVQPVHTLPRKPSHAKASGRAKPTAACHNDHEGGGTQAFLVVVELHNRRLSHSVYVAHVYDGSQDAASHPVHCDDELTPVDSWMLNGWSGTTTVTESSAPLQSIVFHPTSAALVLYPSKGDALKEFDSSDDNQRETAGLWGIDVRDFRLQCVVQRIEWSASLPTLSPHVSLHRLYGKGNALVLVSGESSHDIDVVLWNHVAVDLDKRVAFPMDESMARFHVESIANGNDTDATVRVLMRAPPVTASTTARSATDGTLVVGTIPLMFR